MTRRQYQREYMRERRADPIVKMIAMLLNGEL